MAEDTASGQGASPWRRRIATLGKVLITAVTFYVIVRWVGVDRIVETYRNCDPSWLTLVAIAVVIQLAILIQRWKLIVELLANRPVRYGLLASSYAASFFYGQLLPTSIGGDLIRVTLLTPETGLAVAGRSVLYDRLFGLTSIVWLVFLTLPLFAPVITSGPPFQALAAVSVVAMLAMAVPVCFRARLGALPWIGPHLAMASQEISLILRDRTALFYVVVMGMAVHLLAATCIFAFARMVGAHIALLDTLMLVPPVLLLNALPISVGGWGVREGLLAAAFTLVGTDPADMVATGILYGLTNPVIALVLGLGLTVLRLRRRQDGKAG
jgi:glycosyltransferase 2 family protein